MKELQRLIEQAKRDKVAHRAAGRRIDAAAAAIRLLALEQARACVKRELRGLE